MHRDERLNEVWSAECGVPNGPSQLSTPPALRTPHSALRTPDDPRWAAFTDPAAREVFHSVCHRHEIWRADPFDVATIHAAARDGFAELVAGPQARRERSAGRILLILGESGAGKTHLMRVFRNRVHGERLGYCGYLQMTSATPDYGGYVLSNLIDSLDQPYFESRAETSGLMTLSNALVEVPSSVLRRERDALREERFRDRELAKFVRQLADLIIEDERFCDCDVHVVQALLYLQREEPRIKSRVLSYLRCEALSDHDRAVIGGLVPRTDPERTVEALARVMWRLEEMSLVICVDQLEDMANLDRDAERFRRAMTTVCALAERVPSSVFVIACLEDLYPPLRQSLTRSYVDRIERNPEPIGLDSGRSWEEIVGLVGRRLRTLYESAGVAFDESDPTYPIPEDVLRPLTNTRARDVLDCCRDFRGAAIRGESPAVSSLPVSSLAVPPSGAKAGAKPPADDEHVVRLTQLWNDALATHCDPTTDDDGILAAQLAQAVEHSSDEVTTGHQFAATVDEWRLAVRINGDDEQTPLLVGLCNKTPQGGALSRQIKTLAKQAAGTAGSTGSVAVLVRSTEFPDNPRTKLAQQIAEIIESGGRTVVVEDSDWRAMHAMRAFRAEHHADPAFGEWLRAERPLTRLKSLRNLLGLDALSNQSVAATRRAA